MIATKADAYRLWHRGALALSRAERNGMAVDTDYLREQGAAIDQQMAALNQRMLAAPEWKVWSQRHDRPQLGSRAQLSDVIFKGLGHPQTGAKTEKGADAADEAAFRHIDLPFLEDYFAWQKLAKVKGTYFDGIGREVCDGLIHPSFQLHTVQSYRGSAQNPNVQNIPVRDPVTGPMVRKLFVPRKDPKGRPRRIVEVDLVAAEVRIAYCYHQDPTMRAYLLDPDSDMHGDTAEELFCLPKGFVKANAKWAKRTVRDWAKNRFVFAEFYGDVYFQRAPHLWEALTERDADNQYQGRMPDGTSVLEHLASKGIRSLGACDPKYPPQPGTMEYLVKQVEDSFWQQRFPVYTQWKKKAYREYLSKGYFDLLTGFRCAGIYKRNQVLNFGTQGASFHVLLLEQILMQEWLDKHQMDSLLIAEIHDSLIGDVVEDELQDYLEAIYHIVTVTIPRMWPWLIIPLQIEAEVCEPGESWDRKKLWVRDQQGVWGPKT